MNKKIVAISILMLMMCAMAVSVFAEDGEYTYDVTVRYRLGPQATNGWDMFDEKTYTITARSAGTAEALAKGRWEAEKGRNWVFVSVNAVRR